MADGDEEGFTSKQIEVLKKIANKKLAWGEVIADAKVWMATLTIAFAFVALFRETILSFLGLAGQ